MRLRQTRFRRGVAVAIILILAVSLGLRLWRLTYPTEYVFDEVYYAKDAKSIAEGRVGPAKMAHWMPGDSVSWPHPDMGKFAIAAGIILFGDSALGWRLPSVVAGMAILVCIYPIARRLGLSRGWSLVALLFAAADPLGITQSRIATLDIFVATWSVLCLYFALRYVQDAHRLRWLALCGFTGGMALATKWSGGLALVAALLIVIGSWLARDWQERRRRAAAAMLAQQEALAGQEGRAPAAIGVAAETAETAAPAQPTAWAPDDAAWGSAAEAPAPALAANREAAEYAAWTESVAASAGAAPQAPAAAGTLVQTLAPRRPPAHARREAKTLVLAALPVIAALVLLPMAIYMVSYWQYFASGHTFADWKELQRQMWVFGINLRAEHSYASIAPSWIIDYRPVWYYFQGGMEFRGIVAIGNPFLWWMATLTLLLTPVLLVRRRGAALLIPAAIVVVLYVPWFATARTSFLYYMTPVAPFLAVLVAAALSCYSGRAALSRRAWLMVAAAAVATAMLWYPVSWLGEWLFWTLPSQFSTGLAYAAVGVGVVLGLAAAVVVALPQMRARRPLLALLAVGLIVGIVVAFLPVVLALPISPQFFSHITWFPTWI